MDKHFRESCYLKNHLNNIVKVWNVVTRIVCGDGGSLNRVESIVSIGLRSVGYNNKYCKHKCIHFKNILLLNWVMYELKCQAL